jgi:hypothetical protein
MKYIPLLLSLAASLLFQTAARAESLVPKLMNYQGYLTDSSGDPLGSGESEIRKVTFRFWDVVEAGAEANLLYAESHDVTILEGNFSVLLGNGIQVAGEPSREDVDFNSLFDRAELYLGISPDENNPDVEITPRQQLVSTAFAFRAAVAERVDAQAITADQISPGTITSDQIYPDTITSDEIGTDAITSDEIKAGAVGSAEIVDGTIATEDIDAAAVWPGGIAENAVTTSEIADGTILGADIYTNTITQGKIAEDSIGTSELQDGAVAVANLGYDSVRGDGETLLIVRGVVEFPADVQINDKIYGPGYSVQYEGIGVYEINWTTTFNDLPAVIVNQWQNNEPEGDVGEDDNALIITTLTTTYCKMEIRDTTTKNLEHDKFCFIVIGSK